MEDGGKVISTSEVKPHTVEPTGSVSPADSTSKLSSNELSPDSTSEIENPLTKTERLDSFVASNKVNGDCSVECSVPSPSSVPPNNNNNTSAYKISSERNASYKEKSLIDDIDESASCDSQKTDTTPSEAQIASTKEKEQTKNLSYSSQQKSEHSFNESDDRTLEYENLQCNKDERISNVNEVSSTLEDKNTIETNDINTSKSVKHENKTISTKAKKFATEPSSAASNKNDDTFKTPARYELKSSTSKAKPNEGAMSESGQIQNDVPGKTSEKIGRNNKRKNEDKHVNAYDGEVNETEKFPIQYKGFKKKANIKYEKDERRLNLKWNPFNPACKPNRKSNKCIPSRLPVGDEIDCSALQQSEYAQYLGLQPILKFRCSNCGSSAFQSMVALNTHQIECTKTGKGKIEKTPASLSNSVSEPKSTNIKLTRKVFLCSACGTYYEHWNLFLHMREVHRRYICLYCLGMFSIAEKLSEHLIQKHKISHQNFGNLDDFQKHSYQTFFLLCLACDRVFSEMDDFYGHMCSQNKRNIDNVDSLSKAEATSSQECNPTTAGEVCSSAANNKISTKRTRESSKKSTLTSKTTQIKKDDSLNGNSTQKTDDSVSAECKEEIKLSEIFGNKSVEAVNSSTSENLSIEQSANNVNESDTKSTIEQDVKLQESQVNVESLSVSDKIKSFRRNKPLPKKTTAKRKKTKEKEEESDASAAKIKKVLEEEPLKEPNSPTTDENDPLVPASETEKATEVKEELVNTEVPPRELIEEQNSPEVTLEYKEETDVHEPENIVQEENREVSKEELPVSSVNTNTMDSKNKLQVGLMKFEGIESDNESDDSQKLSLIVDENAHSDTENKGSTKTGDNSATDSDIPEGTTSTQPVKETDNNSHTSPESGDQDIMLASEDVPVMALTLNDKIENIPIQTILKECVRTSCMSCNYCRHAVKIAVNGKQLALHILSEHRYMPIKNETPDDVINKLKTSLESLETIFFNTETYDSSDSSVHVPYDQDSSFDCFQCNYVTSTHRDLFAHKRKSHTKSLLLCIMCKSNFYSYSELFCHLCPGTYNAEVQFHNVDINFRCCFCRLDTIPSAFRLMVHLRKTHHTCDICLENGIDQQKLSTHMWKHKLNHLCYRCGIAYASKPDITKHLFWKHGHESVLCKKCLQKKWPHVYHFCIPPTSFICEECNNSFSKAVALKVHKRIHGNDFPYVCTECSKKFVSKKLLQRHEERHIAIKSSSGQKQSEVSQELEQKDEIINVSDVINENKELSFAADFSDSKEMEPKDKSHKKHKKDKEKKDKQVVDVYDLPPLNLSSESDSSDEDNNINDNLSGAVENSGETVNKEENKKEQLDLVENKEVNNYTQNEDPTNENDSVKEESKIALPNSPLPLADGTTSAHSETKVSENEDKETKMEDVENETSNAIQTNETVAKNTSEEAEKTEQEDRPSEEVLSHDDELNSKEVEDIWKNFYSTNPQNSHLPYPLCAIKSEIALGIIMGDHDYCHQPVQSPPSFREEIPSTSGLSESLINDQLEEVIEPPQEKGNDMPLSKEIPGSSSPVTSPKKKPKSPKKKNSKGENENNNTSSSSDSSSESSSSSCSCGPNCSCSSSSSNSSSSSSSDSESSAGEEGTKQERKRKKRERRSKTKSDHEPELPKTEIQTETEKTVPLEPVDPPIRESELETDETTTDEEFYDQQPQRIANQLLAEKRNQLMLLASAANANNGNVSPSPIVDVIQPEVVTPQKQKVKTKRKRKITTKGKTSSERTLPNSHTYPQYAKDNELTSKPMPHYHSNPLPTPETKLPQFVAQTAAMAETPGSGSETEKSRSSKRRRIPNKFYGYSSGDEEEKPAPSPKWRKQDTIVSQPTRVQQPAHPPTPRIQLTVPKQVIRKPYKFQKSTAKPQPSSSDSTDSGSEMENQRSSNVPAVNQDTSTSATSQKNDKDVYCYCRCPYDEVSEMIACDDENCEIEWFHFECVGILVPPRGQWFCPGCRKARGLPT